MSRQWHPLEVEISKTFKNLGVKDQRLLVAVSGGLDSVALLALLKNLTGLLKLELVVGHIHHGRSSNQGPWRDSTRSFVSNLAQELGLEFRTNEVFPQEELIGEASLRDFRREQLLEIRHSVGAQNIVLAHHMDDLLETRLIRLIRGVGPEGLEAMAEKRDCWVRPLLGVSRKELQEYAEGEELRWQEDPSNEDQRYLRNFIRQSWLPLLETHREGATKALARSLDNMTLSSQVGLGYLSELISEKGVDRSQLAGLGRPAQRQVLVKYLALKKVRGYRLAQVDEALKRLLTERKLVRFYLAGCHWDINAEFIRVNPDPGFIVGKG